MAGHNFLGTGWRFPVQLDRSDSTKTRIAKTDGAQAVEESIRIILGTAKGERIMRPDFGCDLKRLVFAPNNTSTAGLAMFYVREALKKWEPRIELRAVDANPDSDSPERLLINIEYRILGTDTEHNLVYPYYLGRA